MHSLSISQRKFRKKRLSAIRQGTLGLLDIGTSKITCLIIKFTPDDILSVSDSELSRPLKASAFRVVGVATTMARGIRLGEVLIAEETDRAIRTVIQQAQKMADTFVENVLVSFAGGEPISESIFGETRTFSGVVSERDIGSVLSSCPIPVLDNDREILHALPINFSVDEKSGLADPIGQVGTYLSVDMHILTVKKNVLKNLIHCVSRCDLELAGFVFSPYAAGVSSLIEDELQLGAICIDMGGGSTGFSIFLQNQMIYSDAIRMGGLHISSDIMKAFQIPFQDAERIKTLHGGLVATSVDDRDLIELPQNNPEWEPDRIMISRSELISVIRPRVEEILEEVRNALDRVGIDSFKGKKIVLTGGASQLPGMYDLANLYLGSNVRMGRPIRIQGLPQAITGPQFSAVIGMALDSSQPQDEFWDFEMPFDSGTSKNLKRAVNWFKHNW